MSALRSDPLLSEIRHEALYGPDSGSKFAMDALKLCDEFEIMRGMALRADETIHELMKGREKI